MENKKKKFYLRNYSIGDINTKWLNDRVFDGILGEFVNFSQLEAKKIGNIISNLSLNFIMHFYERVEFTNTDAISVVFVDTDNESKEEIQRIISEYRRIGDKKKNDNFGSNCLFISITKLYSLNSENERYIYLLTCIYDSILAFCEKFQIETTEITNAYNFMCTSDFYLPIILKSYQNKKKTYVARIQSKSGFYSDRFRLAILNIEGLEKTYYKEMQNTTNLEIEYYDIGEKETYSEIINRIDFKEYAPFKTGGNQVPAFCFTEEKWISNDVFTFQWGDEEKYEFSLKSRKIEKIKF